MKIIIVAEGRTESAFKDSLVKYLKKRLCGKMPQIEFRPQNGMLPREEKLKKLVEKFFELENANHVIALTDVYTGEKKFQDASDAKSKIRNWVGNEPRFHVHAAQYEFEAWLLPYWETIQKMAGHNKSVPSGNPENVNHSKPPSHWIKEIFEAKGRRSYVKTRDAKAILNKHGLDAAISECAELQALVNTIIEICGGETV